MKLYIKSNRIFGMAFGRKDALNNLRKRSDTLVEHIVKCAVYGNSTNNLDHWVKEICNYLSAANKVTVKPNDRRLKANDYLISLFASMGDQRIDAEYALYDFYADNEHRKEYPHFEATDEIVDKIFEMYNAIKEYMLPILTKQNNLTTDDFYDAIYKIVS